MDNYVLCSRFNIICGCRTVGQFQLSKLDFNFHLYPLTLLRKGQSPVFKTYGLWLGQGFVNFRRCVQGLNVEIAGSASFTKPLPQSTRFKNWAQRIDRTWIEPFLWKSQTYQNFSILKSFLYQMEASHSLAVSEELGNKYIKTNK